MGPKVWEETECLLPILNHEDKALLYANYVSLHLKYSYSKRCKPDVLYCQNEVYDQRVGHSVLCDLFSVTVVENILIQ